MPWPEGTPNWLKNQWGIISGQVSARATTAQLVESLRPYATAAPGGWGPRGVIVLGQIRSMAVKIRESSRAISAQDLTGSILAEHIADTPWGRSPIQQSLAPRFMIRALVESPNPEAIAGVAGVPATLQNWITHYTSVLPGTFDQLTSKIIEQAGETGSPPAPVTAIAQLEILRE